MMTLTTKYGCRMFFCSPSHEIRTAFLSQFLNCKHFCHNAYIAKHLFHIFVGKYLKRTCTQKVVLPDLTPTATFLPLIVMVSTGLFFFPLGKFLRLLGTLLKDNTDFSMHCSFWVLLVETNSWPWPY